MFDITHVGLKNWYGTIFGLCFLAVWILAMRYGVRRQPFWSRHPEAFQVFAVVTSVLIVFWTAVDGFFTNLHHNHLRSEFERGRFSVVEGIVSDFSPETLGRKKERFCVRGHCFEYSEARSIAGFNDSNQWGGPIRSGLHVRVSYVGYQIVKLEVGR